MNENDAMNYMAEAKILKRRATGLGNYFWEGYMQGVRRAWHGEGFGEEKHAALMGTLEEEIFDDSRLQIVRGYKAGLAEMTPKEAVKEFFYA